MATVERKTPATAEQRIVIHGVSWDTYLSLSNCSGTGPVQLAYDQGMLEIMAPSYYHELMSQFIGRLVGILTEELGMGIRSGGSTTMRSEWSRRGAEADQIYHIRRAAAVRGRREFDPTLPPDLAIEVDLTASSSSRLPIYSTLGIPEIWRYDGERLTILGRADDGEYRPIDESLSFPKLTAVELEPYLAEYDDSDENDLVRKFRQWVRDSLRPESTS
ncbi:MAG TPA: Uma2 family endonuclease [Pirellulales bacterium]|jgi:Uma2 family endonuclease|nr:Uma2 family endonuclease [Pirellulales bacterium]